MINFLHKIKLLQKYKVFSISNGIKISKNKGIATLPTVIVIGLVALAVVVSITSVALNELLISQGSSQSSSALFYAEGGARDALVRIARKKNYICDATNSCETVGYYSLNFVANGCTSGDGCAKVTVSPGVGTTGDPKIIISTGIKGASIRRMQVSVVLDGGTSTASLQHGLITTTAWTELTD